MSAISIGVVTSPSRLILSREVGFEAETLAAEALKGDGYDILERNYSCRMGEIDIIAMKDGFICFVEVKYRRPSGHGTAVDAITKSKLRKIMKASRDYLYQTGQADVDYRIDAVVIDSDRVEILPNIYTEGMNDV